MSHSQLVIVVVLFLILFSSVLEVKVFGDKIKEKIYQKLNSSACVTLLNATHQIGCTSEKKGNVGVIHYIESDEDFEWLLNKGEHAPYVPLFEPEYFTHDRFKKLVDADKVAGALVNYDTKLGTKLPAGGFSPEYDCPKDNFGLYKDHPEFSCSARGNRTVVWNKIGSAMSYKQYNLPVSILNAKEVATLVNCYKQHNKPINGTKPEYPLCAVEMKSFMFAAKDTPTCMRKNDAPTFTQNRFCDPLGDHSVWGTLFPLAGKLGKNDVVLATAQLDSTSFFHEAARGADNDASGVVVLLAVAKALGELKREGKIKPPDLKNGEKHIMFTFFQGEAWDYIGSSRMVFDMIQGKFPCVKDCTKVNISNIAYFLELNQVGLYNEGLWAHSDPLSKSNVGTKVSEMFKTLSDFAANASLLIGNASDKTAQPLPPASFQRFLRKSLHIPGLVVTDHKASYTNKYYNSRLDEWYNLNFNGSFNSPTVKRLTSLAETVANTLYKLAYSKTRTDANVLLKDEDVGDLLACFLVSKNCSTFRKATTEQDLHILEKNTRPFGRYVGTYKKQKVRYHPITTMTGRVLSYFMRNEKCDTSTETCSGNQENFIFNSTEGCCVNSSAFPYPAMSPAFLLEDYTSTEYSTWTESSWGDDIAIRMFLLPDPVQEVITLIVGIVLTLLSIMVTVFMYTNAEQLFTPDDCVLVINNVQ